MNILFVIPKYGVTDEPYEFPLGIAYVAAYLKKSAFNVFCLNANHHAGAMAEQLSKWINDNDIDMVCSGGLSMHLDSIGEVFAAAKRIKKGIITVCGGPLICCDPEFALERLPVDFAIMGEGEETMADLARALATGDDIMKVKGLVYDDVQGNLVFTEKRPPIADLDIIPMPDYASFDYDIYMDKIAPNTPYHFFSLFDRMDEVRPASIITSRSCPFNCTFCYHPLGKKYRQHPLDKVFEEIDYLIENYGINFLFIIDHLFAFDKKRMLEFAERIKPYKIKWVAQLRVTDANLEVLHRLKESGLIAIGYGVESLSDKILKSMKKKITREQIENGLRITREAKIAVVGNLLFGDPAETEETIEETLSWWKDQLEYNLYLRMIMPIPDSVIYRLALGRGLIKDKLKHIKEGFPPVNLTELSEKRFKEITDFTLTYRNDEKYLIMGRLINSKKEYGNNRKLQFSITVECPECHEIMHYTPIPPQTCKTLLLLCKSCLASFHVRTKYLKQFSIIHPLKIIKKHVKNLLS